MNLLIALIPAIGWGTMPLILKKIKGKPKNEILGTGIGSLLVGIIVHMSLSPQSIDNKTFLLSIFSGMFWVIGQVGQYNAYNLLGVSNTMPITTGLQLIGTSLIGVIAFGEWSRSPYSKIIGAIAIILLIIGAGLTTIRDNKDKSEGFVKGIILLALTSVGYWVYSALPKIVNADGISIFFPQMLGVFLGSVIYVIIFRGQDAFTDKHSWKAGLAGILFSISALAYTFSAQENGVATAYIITQLNVVIATLSGIFILKEKKSSRELKFTILGLLIIILASVITIFL